MSPHNCKNCLKDRIARMAESKKHFSINGVQENGDSSMTENPC